MHNYPSLEEMQKCTDEDDVAAEKVAAERKMAEATEAERLAAAERPLAELERKAAEAKSSPPLANSVPFPHPLVRLTQDMSIPAHCSCTEYVRIKTIDIMKKETGSLDVLMSMLASADPTNLQSIVDFIRPTSVDNSEDNFEAWAIDKAQFMYSEYIGQNRRTYNLCARFLVVQGLLTYYPRGPYYSFSVVEEKRDALKKGSIQDHHFYWPDNIVDFLLQNTAYPWMALHVEGQERNLDPTSKEFKKCVTIEDSANKSGALLHSVPAVLLRDPF